jgi:hypothetical protein
MEGTVAAVAHAWTTEPEARGVPRRLRLIVD